MKSARDLLRELARVSGKPPKEWEGNCFLMASHMVNHNLIDGAAVYGHWVGPVVPNSIFFKKKTLSSFVQHGWVRNSQADPSERIIDPTRWVFEGKRPYIYIGPSDHYDEGGNQFRRTVYTTAPTLGPSSELVTLTRLPMAAWKRIQHVLTTCGSFAENPVRTVSLAQLFWIANQPPDVFLEHTPAIYLCFERIGRRALIPIDNQRMVERGDWMSP